MANDDRSVHNVKGGVPLLRNLRADMRCAQIWTLNLRKSRMGTLLEKENRAYQKELKEMGLLFWYDTTAAQLRICNKNFPYMKGKRIGYKGHASSVGQVVFNKY